MTPSHLRKGLRRLTRFVLAGVVLAVLSGFGSGERLFAPSADLWPRWQEHDPTSQARIDHAAWDVFLARYLVVDEEGLARLRYAAVSDADAQALADYLAFLSDQAIGRFARDEQMAFWINLYNALTVKVVLDHYPVASIRDIDISPGLFADGPWGKNLVTLEGEALSLNDIEHRILRPIWRDPRVHYAVNCASVGCPNLQVRAYRAANLDADLEAAARDYVNSPRGVAIVGGKVTVSKIYDWFIEDFGGTPEAVLAHLLRYAEPDLGASLKKIGRLDEVAYDWSLNEAPEP